VLGRTGRFHSKELTGRLEGGYETYPVRPTGLDGLIELNQSGL